MNLRLALDYLKTHYDSMKAESQTMVGVDETEIPAGYPCVPDTYILDYEPLVENHPSGGFYRLELMQSAVYDKFAPRVVVYGDNLDELIAANPDSSAITADYDIIQPQPNICSPEVNAEIDNALLAFEAYADTKPLITPTT